MFENFRSYFKADAEVPPQHQQKINQLEQIFGTSVDNPLIYMRALRHRSKLEGSEFSSVDSYERLEFLGDAVLDLIVTEIIFDLYPEKNEGFLTKLRAKLVKGDQLARYAKELALGNLLVLGERVQGQGIERSKSILADVFEALTGALYVDQGYDATLAFVRHIIQRYVNFDDLIGTLDNFKSLLLEYAQAHQMKIPTYQVKDRRGPGHNLTFEIEVNVDGKPTASGTGKSKKEAEQKAAHKALEKLK